MAQEHISLLLADEHQLYREALATTLTQSRLVHIAGQSGTGPQAEQLFHELRPDIPDMEDSGIRVRRHLAREIDQPGWRTDAQNAGEVWALGETRRIDVSPRHFPISFRTGVRL